MLETLDDYKRDLEATKLAMESAKRAATLLERLTPEGRFSFMDTMDDVACKLVAEKQRAFLLNDLNLLSELRQLARFEGIVDREENHAALALQHSVAAERVLREGLLERSGAIAEPILQSYGRSGARDLLEGYYENKLKPTLGLVELFGFGLRRCLETDQPAVCEWVDTGFAPDLSQDPREPSRLVRNSLKDRAFGLFVAHLRERIRNPVAHGLAGVRFDFDQYRQYCQSAYGHSSLQLWVRSDFRQAGPEGPAWIAMITITAIRTEDSLYSRTLRAFKRLF
jgi:hypothetical protein